MTYHLVELAVLNHHGMNNAKETLVRGKQRSSSSQSVALEEPLTGMLRENLDDSSTSGIGKLIPLHIPASMSEYGIKLVTDQLIRREDPHALWILHQYLVKKLPDGCHAACLAAFLDAELLPIRDI